MSNVRAHMKQSRAKGREIALLIGLIIAVTVIAGFIYDLGGPSGNRLKYFALLASLGGLLGTSIALDGRSDIAAMDSTPLRIGLSALFGAAAMLVVWSWLPDFPVATCLIIGAVIGAILGFFGWDWAKHVDF